MRYYRYGCLRKGIFKIILFNVRKVKKVFRLKGKMKLIEIITTALLLAVLPFTLVSSEKEKNNIQEYMIQIKEEWIDTIKIEAPRFGFRYKRKLVSNIFLFEEDLKPSDQPANVFHPDMKAFKEFFAKKILHVKKREKVIVKYYPWRNGSLSQSQTTFGRWILRPRTSAHSKQCWPYYGMDVQEAWSLGYTGVGVRVAVVDIGVEMEHPDLTKNLDKNFSYSFVDGDHSDVNPQRFQSYWETEEITSHGTMAAGLIAGEFGNNHCSSGIAFDSKLAALKVFRLEENPTAWAVEGFAFSVEHIPSAISYENDGIDIYSCSFNLHNKFKSATPEMRAALEEGAKKGRKGKGSVYVFSAGNNKGPVYDCNMEALANSIYTITISSVGANGSKPAYAIPCACTLASTYGEFNTHEGSKTLESTTHGGKCDNFMGTSASAALASGIFALALQANSDLTMRDLQYITILSSSFESLQHTGRRKRNAAGQQYDPYFGFGLINATSMVLKAKTWKTVSSQNEQTVHESDSKMRFISEDTLVISLRLDSCEKEENCIRFLEHVQVSLKYNTKKEPLFDIVLCSPSKTCSYLLNRKSHVRHKTADALRRRVYRNWNFTSVHFWGENPTGRWLLLFRKGKEPKTRHLLQFKSAVLTLFGTSVDTLGTNYVKSIQNDTWLPNDTEWYNTVAENTSKDLSDTVVDEVFNNEEKKSENQNDYMYWVWVVIIFVVLTVCVIITLVVRYIYMYMKQKIILALNIVNASGALYPRFPRP
ncbi:neuroendocrine convertase 2-like [Mercenaria mercenaria]|uniref:neuroendocrine convertase 2-like n=1 Tax=Mercenaria mercenaria TaxID=6596 RepID=UPI00234EB00A|nr:neuroendocrine convertase 2-like [Mercenaria mercenaria]